ncbi:MAG: Hsp20/alpha crystallin family protein [Nitrospirae bacterium]|nr:Hsp20/alpha crystallin family protein [Nitrospirota bacterium]
MTLIRWTPAKELESIRRDMERLMEDFVEPFGRRRAWLPRTAGERGVIAPNVDVYDRKTEVVVRVELPGVEKENVDLTITNESISIKGELKKTEGVKDEDYYCSECSYGGFQRTIPMPVEIDASKAKASFKNGILEVVLPKLEAAKAKEVKLKID